MPRAARHTVPAAVPRLLAGDRTLRSWVAARSRRTPTGLSSASRRRARAALLAEPVAAVATRAAARAAVARPGADPNRAELAAARRKARPAEAERRNQRAARRWHRTDSTLRASLAGSGAVQRGQSPAAEVAVPTLLAVARLEAERRAAAGNHPTAQAAAVEAAARTEVLAAVVRPIAARVEEPAEPRREPAARSAAGDLAGLVPAPLRQARPLPKARRKIGKTCWWAGWLRHTACRRS